MVEEYCYPIKRLSLGDYYEMAWRCAKCAFCRNVLPSDTEDERFAAQCPPGDRFKYESYFASGRNEMARRTIEGKQGFTERSRHILYTCTTCGACEEWCSATQGLYPLKIIMAMRENFLKKGGEILPEHQQIVENLRQHHNRLGRNNRDRFGWVEAADKAVTEDVDLVYFVGCRSSFKRTEIAKATLGLLKKLGLKVGLIADERCCGRPLIDIGREDLAVDLLRHNVEQIRAMGAKQVLFSCAECFHNFNIVEKYGISKDFEAVHLSQLLASSLKAGKLKLGALKGRITFHDPCYLGRHQGVYDQPREVLGAIGGAELVELPRNRKNAWCCGSGGGVQEAFPDYTSWIAAERIEEVKAVEAELVVTSCPGCKNNLWKHAKENQVEILDLAELMARVVEEIYGIR